jgi:heat shock protein HslJ
VQIGELLSTRRACADDARQRQEDRLLKILQGSANLQMRRNRLTVQSDDGAVVLSERR